MNIVSMVNLDSKLDLKAIALQARNAEYNPKDNKLTEPKSLVHWRRRQLHWRVNIQRRTRHRIMLQLSPVWQYLEFLTDEESKALTIVAIWKEEWTCEEALPNC